MDHRLLTILHFRTVSEINLWTYDDGTDFILEYCLFGAVKVTKNSGPDKYSNYE